MMNLDKKQKQQAVVLSGLLIMVGWLGWDALFGGPANDPRINQYQTSQPVAAQKSNINRIVETVEVEVQKEPPTQVVLDIAQVDYFDTKILQLNAETRLLKAQIANQELKNEFAELKAVLEPPAPSEYFPEMGMMPQNVQSVQDSPAFNQRVPDVSSSVTASTEILSSQPSYDEAQIFGSISVSSLMNSEDGVFAWLRLHGRSTKVTIGSTIGEYTISEVTPQFIAVKHNPSELVRKFNAPGFAYLSDELSGGVSHKSYSGFEHKKSSDSSNSSSGASSQSSGSSGGSGIPIDIPAAMLR
ncbi:hypothetical protein [Vibrio mediterranei]|uniref:hypothetical protein n=1 Tax=Vibrio mediterranei TaxID=689 RepID=UPI004069807F